MRNPVAFQRQELFPTYPWLWDLDNICTHKFLYGTVPDNWRRFQGNADWIYALDPFPALV